MAKILLQNSNGKWVKHNEFIALLILLFQGRKDDVDWILSNWAYCSNVFIKIPYKEMKGIDISKRTGW